MSIAQACGAAVGFGRADSASRGGAGSHRRAPEAGAGTGGCPAIAGLSACWTVLRNLGVLGHPRAARDRRARAARGAERAVDGAQPLPPLRIQGEGPPVVLVHGLGGSQRDWDRVAAALARAHRVIRYDARGHGTRVADGEDTLDLPRLAAELAAVVAAQGAVRPWLVGHSMGALTVLQYLHEHGDAAIAGACLIDQSPRIVTDADWRCGLFGAHSAARHESLLARMREDFAGTVLDEAAPALPRSLRAAAGAGGAVRRLAQRALAPIRTDALIALLASLGRADFRDLIPTLAVPVLVVLGGRSHHYGGVPLGDWYRTRLTRGDVLSYPRSGHSPHRHEAARLARDLAAFVAGGASAGHGATLGR